MTDPALDRRTRFPGLPERGVPLTEVSQLFLDHLADPS